MHDIPHTVPEEARKFGAVLAENPRSALVISAEAFGNPDALQSVLIAIDAAITWPTGYQRHVVATLGWASDEHVANWKAAGWGVVEAHPRPRSFLSLQAIRRLFKSGPVFFHPADAGGEFMPQFDQEVKQGAGGD